MVHATEVILTRIETLFRDGSAMVTIAEGGTPLKIDGITGALATISTVHEHVHGAETFEASYKSPDGAEVVDDAFIEMLLQVGARYPHLFFTISCGGDSEAALYEGTTFSDAGTALAANNMNRPIATTATTVVTYTPTITLPGTLLFNNFIPGGVGPKASGGTIRQGTERVLIPGTNYLIRGINRSGNPQPMAIVAQWYEESTNA